MRLNKRTVLVCGIGINDADYNIHRHENGKLVWRCPFYKCWSNMIKRCYHPSSIKASPSYNGCSVVPEWTYFSKFRAWMEQQDWQGNVLDKDLLIKGNKEYGPNACLFVPPKVNGFMVEKPNKVSGLPVGVILNVRDGKFMALCNYAFGGQRKYLGLFSTQEEAHKAWLAFKLEQAYVLAAEQTDDRVAKALIDRYENYALAFA